MTHPLTLFTKPGCPFAERTRIVLALLRTPHEVVTVDVYEKPDWFERLSPLGKAPMLRHGDAVLFESTAINEYLVEMFGRDGSLIPATPAARAEMRAWVQFDETALTPAFYRLTLETDPALVAIRRETYLQRRRVLERRLQATPGPLLFSGEATLADIALFPHLARIAVIAQARGLSAQDEGGAVDAFLTAMRTLPDLAAATASPEEVLADLTPYLDGRVAGETRRDMTGLARPAPRPG